jgi:hypothetical protein
MVRGPRTALLLLISVPPIPESQLCQPPSPCSQVAIDCWSCFFMPFAFPYVHRVVTHTTQVQCCTRHLSRFLSLGAIHPPWSELVHCADMRELSPSYQGKQSRISRAGTKTMHLHADAQQDAARDCRLLRAPACGASNVSGAGECSRLHITQDGDLRWTSTAAELPLIHGIMAKLHSLWPSLEPPRPSVAVDR